MAEGTASGSSIAAGGLQTEPGDAGRHLIAIVENWLEAERDQLALWIPVALAAGIAAWFALPDQASWTALFVALLGVSAVGLTLGHDRRAGRALAIAGATAALGLALVWTRSERVAAPRLERPVVTSFDARISAAARLPEGAVRLNPSAAEVLELCDGARSLDDIVGVLAERYGDADVRDDVQELVDAMAQRGLLVDAAG